MDPTHPRIPAARGGAGSRLCRAACRRSPPRRRSAFCSLHRTTEGRQCIRAKGIAAGCRVEHHAHRAPATGKRDAETGIAFALDARAIEQTEPRPRPLRSRTGNRTTAVLEGERCLAGVARPGERAALLRTVTILEDLPLQIEREAVRIRVEELRSQREARLGILCALREERLAYALHELELPEQRGGAANLRV